MLGALFLAPAAQAQSVWDPLLSNSNWYVTVPQMLAYAAPDTSFANPLPIGDQTLWALGTSTDGVFTGTSTGTLAIGPIVSTSELTIQGTVTPAGQISMVFTSTDGGPSTIGLGRMVPIGDTISMEMQMIIGTDLLVSHWAYMLPYDPAVFTPPEAQVVPSNLSPQWAWSQGTPWRIVSPEAFGTAQPGTFIITGYKSGYFWGEGLRPDGTAFTLLGSITPEGRVLFNTITDGELASLYGGIEGDASDAQMLLGTYDSSAVFTGDITQTTVVRPYVETVAATGTAAALGAARTLYAVAGTTDGLFGAMAPVTLTLNDLGGPALSGAISQTLPVLAGAATEATANIQRMLGQVVTERLDAAPETSRAWVRPLGGGGHQSAIGGVPGYSFDGGGAAFGVDRSFDGAFRAGALFAFTSTGVSADTDAARANLATGTANLRSYTLGAYGSYALGEGLDLSALVNAGLVDTDTSRTIGFMGTQAQGDYQSRVLQLGARLRGTLPAGGGLTLMPAVRLDFLGVDADSYSETGAGPLNLAVDGQTYRELFLSGELALRYALTETLALTARGSVGYDLIGDTGGVTAAFAGGGDPFVTPGADLSPWLFTAGLGLVAQRSETLSFEARYDVQASPSAYLNQTGSLAVKWRL
ncbi:autotransporter outer membrane beta-barrel domain-containing protein [Ancylobacter sp. IITR112]|uniref:autotransporter outer membrane beta-barrel domain-containing protein n=1 Tax=Ancylobacter sp. IITR112 TaxID=3138073 RepID=UPI00352B1CA2